MSEGGIFPWKIQKIHTPKNGISGTCRYSDISRPLPNPPKGMTWIQNEKTREWSLVSVVELIESRESEESASGAVEAGDVAGGAVASGAAAPEPAVMTVASIDTTAGSPVVACVAVPVINIGTLHDEGSSRVGGDNIAEAKVIQHHEVKPTDTIQGICLKYQITSLELRRANNLLGDNLQLAPRKLIIPLSSKNGNSVRKQLQKERQPTKEQIIVELRSKQIMKLSYTEAKAYLEMNDWDLSKAIDNVKEDLSFDTA